MITLEKVFFALAALFVLVGGIGTVAAKNPIRGAMFLLASILGVAGMFLLLSAEFLAVIQLLVYAGAVVILFIFVIMLLGPSATSERDARTAIPRYMGAGLFLTSALGALAMVHKTAGALTTFLPPPAGLGTIEAFGKELFTTFLTPFEVTGILLLVAVVGAVAVARGKQVDPTGMISDGERSRQAIRDHYGKAASAAPPVQPAKIAGGAS